MKNLFALLSLTIFLTACGGGGDVADTKPTSNFAVTKTCDAGLTLAGDLCVPKPAAASVALQTM
jgi:hypothetical protein